MDAITLLDGLTLTVVSMILVFIVLGSIGNLIELVAKFVNESEEEVEETQSVKPVVSTDPLQVNEEYQFVAEMMALVLASEDEPDRQFEVVEAKRIQ